MVAYERFAAFYDVVMDDPGPRAARVDAAIRQFRPDPASLLELGCGTGSILARLETGAELTGLDRSPEMLAVASSKVPGVRLVEPGDQPQQRALAAAAAADDGDELAGGDMQVKLVQHARRAELLDEAAHGERRAGRRICWSAAVKGQRRFA